MSLRINTNVPAMMALRNLGNTSDNIAMSISRLSTGLKITTAADDPAGLIISEGMRAQLSGISRAIQNSQDAVNMSKTAEGALNEVQTLLTNIRGIAVHAANSAVVDSAQLEADQQQIQSTIQSIDRIASTTSFGTKKLLNGTAGITANVTDSTDVGGAYFGSSFGGLQISNGPVTVTRTTAAAQTSLQTNRAFTATTDVVPAGSFAVNGYTFTTDGTTDTVSTLVAKINAQASNTGVTASPVSSGGFFHITLTANNYGSQFPVSYFDANNTLNTVANPAPTVAGADAVATVTASILTSTGALSTTTVNFTGGRGPKESGLRLSDSQGNMILMTGTGNTTGTLSSATGIGTIAAGNVRFQIGAYSTESVSYGMPDSRASNLGTGVLANQSLSTIDVRSSNGAQNAMDIIDSAITQLASMRGNLGSFQKNFLESTVRSLGVAQENLTSTESTIRDADMAEEITRYTRLQVLQSSGMSVLSQANQAPNQVLQLLKGG